MLSNWKASDLVSLPIFVCLVFIMPESQTVSISRGSMRPQPFKAQAWSIRGDGWHRACTDGKRTILKQIICNELAGVVYIMEN
jgi:hypothetical protein